MGVAGCAQNCSSAQKERFFRLPSIVKTDETSQKLSGQRRDIWLSRINRKDLTPSQLAEKNSTLHVCGSRFILGRPAAVCLKSLKRELNSLNYDETKFSNNEHNRVSYYTGLACLSTLITLCNLVKSEIKSGNKLPTVF